MKLHGGSSADRNAVCHLIAQDLSGSDVAFAWRTIHGIISDGIGLRHVTATGSIDSPLYWCASTLVGAASTLEMNQALQERKPSAHTIVTHAGGNIAAFLDPTTGTNDSATLNESTGVIIVRDRDYDVTSGMSKSDFEGVARGEPPRRPGTATSPTSVGRAPPSTATGPTSTSPGGWCGPPALPGAHHDQLHAGRIDTTYDRPSGTAPIPPPTSARSSRPTRKDPKVPTGQNGAGDGAPHATRKEYHDENGQMRWSQDGEDRVSYFAYDPDNGKMVCQVEDVNTSDPPPAVTESWSGNPPFPYAGADALARVTRTESDALGRQTKLTEPGGRITCTVYLDNETRVYPAWDGETDKPLLPIQVTRNDDAGQVTETFAVDPSGVSLTEPPDGSENLSRSGAVRWLAWTRNNLDERGRVASTDSYFAIPAEDGDPGQVNANFLRASHAYDTLGRRYKTTSPAGRIEWTQYDALDRGVGTWRGTLDAGSSPGGPTGGGHAAGNNMKLASKVFYDESTPGHADSNGNHDTAGVGDGLVTSTCTYYDDNLGADDTNAVVTAYWRDWRGRLRGTQAEAAPHAVQDVDNLGRVTHAARYRSAPNWSDGAASVVAKADYAATTALDPATSAKRGSLARTLHDPMGRVYRTEVYAINPSTGALVEDGNHLKTDNYFDRNSRLVASSAPARGGTELAFDGVGEQIESRTVTALVEDDTCGKYDEDGAFRYREPTPMLHLDDMGGGGDGVVELRHTSHDAAGNAIASSVLELNHTSPSGIDLDTPNFVQTTGFAWFDGAGRMTASAACGTATANGWTYAPRPARTDRPPDRSDPAVIAGEILLTSQTHDAAGRVQCVTDPQGVVSKAWHDDLGRRTATVENYHPGPDYWTREPLQPKARDADACAVTATTHDPAGNRVLSIVVDPDHDGSAADNQVTVYSFEDPYDAALVTRIKYPDSVDARHDAVSYAYALDGAVTSMTAQTEQPAGVADVLCYHYDTLRRLTRQSLSEVAATTDAAVRAIGCSFDDLEERTGSPPTTIRTPWPRPTSSIRSGTATTSSGS